MGILRISVVTGSLISIVVSFFIPTLISSAALANDERAQSPATDAKSCELVFVPKFIAVAPKLPKEIRREAFAVIPKVNAYFKAVNERVLERADLVELAEVALIAEEHLLMMGPPGNAKSQLSDVILGGITTDGTEKSYFRIQMTPETTMSETHGPMDYKKLSETGAYDRLHAEGMGAKRNVFIDEIFDARANAQRNILTLLVERVSPQGSHVIKADIETAIAATNRYLSEVYEKAGDDGPKAVIDRFALIAFVPATFESTDSYVKVIQRSKQASGPTPELRFDDLETLRAMLSQVEISTPVAKALSLISSRMKGETEALEAASVKSYLEKLKNGEDPGVPYRATKYHSPRTIGKASAILKAFIVKDWVQKGGKRKLEATIKDLALLEKFFTLNGPGEAFIKSEIARTSNAHERAQLSAILQEREIFERHYNKVIEEMDSASVHYALTDLAGRVSAAHTLEERQGAAQSVLAAITKVATDKELSGLHSELDGVEIGREFVQEYLEGMLRGLVTSDELKQLKVNVLAHIERERRAAIAQREKVREEELAKIRLAEREAARAAAVERAAQEAAEKRSVELKEAFTNPDKVKVANAVLGYDPRNKQAIVGFNSATGIVAVYNETADSLKLFDMSTIGGRELKAPVDIASVLGSEKISGMPIGELHFASAEELVLLSANGQVEYRYNIQTRTTEMNTISLKPMVTSFNEVSGKTLSIDPSSMKVRTLESGNGTAVSYVFKSNPKSTLTEAGFKNLASDSEARMHISASGKYAVLVSGTHLEHFKIDFESQTVSPLVNPRLNMQKGFSPETDKSMLNFSGENILALDVSGEEPALKPLIDKSSENAYFGQGSSLVSGTNLIVGARTGQNGWHLVNGADGSVVIDSVFANPGHTAYGMVAVKDGFVMFTVANSGWQIQFVRFKVPPAQDPSDPLSGKSSGRTE